MEEDARGVRDHLLRLRRRKERRRTKILYSKQLLQVRAGKEHERAEEVLQEIFWLLGILLFLKKKVQIQRRREQEERDPIEGSCLVTRLLWHRVQMKGKRQHCEGTLGKRKRNVNTVLRI